MKIVKDSETKRKMRVRSKLRKCGNGQPRLSVFRSNKNIYAQIIDDEKGTTLVSASTIAKDQKAKSDNGSNVVAAQLIGKLVAEKALKQGIKNVIFDRGPYLYHGRVKALADGAREAGLLF